MGYKVLATGFGGLTSWIVDGMIRACDADADVINMSLGGYNDPADPEQADDYLLWVDAVDYCRAQGTAIVASAPHAPPAGVVGTQDNLAYYSSYGERVDVAAPGGARRHGVPEFDTRPGTDVLLGGWGQLGATDKNGRRLGRHVVHGRLLPRLVGDADPVRPRLRGGRGPAGRRSSARRAARAPLYRRDHGVTGRSVRTPSTTMSTRSLKKAIRSVTSAASRSGSL
jgi:hypothetical protein